MNYIHSSHDFTIVIHLCIISCALLLGSTLRSKIKVLQKYLIPAPMIGGLFLFIFYNYVSPYLNLQTGTNFLEELMFHLLNVSFIAMQLRIPVKKEKIQRKGALWSNVTALLAEYGLQCCLGLLAAVLLLRKFLPGSSVAIGLTLCLGFELGPGQAESMAKVWEGAPYNVANAGDVGLTMAAIGFVIGSVIGVVLINRAAKKGWLSADYVEKLRNRKVGNGFFRLQKDRVATSFQTTVSESMDTFTLHLALIFCTYLLSFLVLAGLEWIVARFIGGKVLEAVTGLWGINFVVSMLCAILVRKLIIAAHAEHVIDNHTCNRIDGIAVDFTVAACLGAIEIAAIRQYWVPILVLTVIGVGITCFLTPWFCSRLFKDFSFMRFLMIFGTANGTLPTALSLVRVVDPDFETPVAQEYANSTGVMFLFALPILALVNWPAKGNVWPFIGLTAAYVIIAFVLYLKLAGKRTFAKGGYFYMP
ncbi:MAG: sodium:glutamate symporter, partial [Spirochaetales bacterium]|nr:sodium:glutamate symporter [Spirochaetales bacterium]